MTCTHKVVLRHIAETFHHISAVGLQARFCDSIAAVTCLICYCGGSVGSNATALLIADVGSESLRKVSVS